MARSLLSSALDETDPDTRRIVELLDGIPGVYERAQLGLGQANAGLGYPTRRVWTRGADRADRGGGHRSRHLSSDSKGTSSAGCGHFQQLPRLGAELEATGRDFVACWGPGAGCSSSTRTPESEDRVVMMTIHP